MFQPSRQSNYLGGTFAEKYREMTTLDPKKQVCINIQRKKPGDPLIRPFLDLPSVQKLCLLDRKNLAFDPGLLSVLDPSCSRWAP